MLNVYNLSSCLVKLQTPMDTSDRPAWLGLLATAPPDRLLALAEAAGATAPHGVLRGPEIGTVMLRGRAGGTGAPFNLGEITVTRASIRLTEGPVGHGHVQGRSHRAALAAAVIDALMQTPRAESLRRQVLEPLAADRTARRESRAARAAATRVDFFTLVRGED
jgi:alpha-D-ribose 1-methylphosphonate 5-triphosphate synthase subunit PhnG